MDYNADRAIQNVGTGDVRNFGPQQGGVGQYQYTQYPGYGDSAALIAPQFQAAYTSAGAGNQPYYAVSEGQSGYDPSRVVGYGQNITGQAEQVPQLIQALYQSGFDPQGQLRDQFSQGVTDRARASLASSGLAGTPYGLGVQSDNETQGALAWGDRQLGRQIGAGSAIGNLLGQYTGAYQGAAGIEQMPVQLQLAQHAQNQNQALQGTQLQNEVLGNWLRYLDLNRQVEQGQAQAYNDYTGANLDRSLANLKQSDSYYGAIAKLAAAGVTDPNAYPRAAASPTGVVSGAPRF